MYKTSVTYVDFDGNTRTEELYFNLSTAEITEMEVSYPGGYAKMLDSIVKSQDNGAIYRTFKEIVDKAYGIKSEDGKYFRKSPNALIDFQSSGAYDQFLINLLADGGKTAAEFVNGIMPQTNMSTDELMAKTKALIEEKKTAATEM